jgi:hypothetical protein
MRIEDCFLYEQKRRNKQILLTNNIKIFKYNNISIDYKEIEIDDEVDNKIYDNLSCSRQTGML